MPLVTGILGTNFLQGYSLDTFVCSRLSMKNVSQIIIILYKVVFLPLGKLFIKPYYTMHLIIYFTKIRKIFSGETTTFSNCSARLQRSKFLVSHSYQNFSNQSLLVGNLALTYRNITNVFITHGFFFVITQPSQVQTSHADVYPEEKLNPFMTEAVIIQKPVH